MKKETILTILENTLNNNIKHLTKYLAIFNNYDDCKQNYKNKTEYDKEIAQFNTTLQTYKEILQIITKLENSTITEQEIEKELENYNNTIKLNNFTLQDFEIEEDILQRLKGE